MICYRDMTFCPFFGCVSAGSCPRALTDDVRELARAAGLPICQFVDRPDCWEEPGGRAQSASMEAYRKGGG